MLIEFRVSNYRSIGEEQVLSLVPAPKQKEHPQNIIESETYNLGKYRALNALAIYGANASGKSNLLKAMKLIDRIISLSFQAVSTQKLPYEPFLLRDGWAEKPTSYEITFSIDKNRYRYGFEFNQSEIISEWLFKKSKSRERELFQRSGNNIDVSSALKGSVKVIDAAIEATRRNALFLSTCDAFNIEEAKNILKWFQNYIVISGLNTQKEAIKTVRLFEDEIYQQKIKDYFIKLNFGIVDLDVTSRDFDVSELEEEIPEELKSVLISTLTGTKRYTVFSTHNKYDKHGNKTSDLLTWKLEEKESEGTKKSFHLSGAILWTLINGGVLIIDEIEASMHPKMTLHTINMFLDKEINIYNAQLIFATHDTNLLSYANLRRDQIYFSEKNQWESTEFYSLSDFVYFRKNGDISNIQKERPDTDKEKRYFEGRYGAIPILGNFNPIKGKKNGKQD
ncbi:MAG: ATP-binding protein [Pseudanabaenaceae cyanobacterium bins.39]|nr:ATP-binding protein [Pseudanabaenaceae cyanobacterium bins.39]